MGYTIKQKIDICLKAESYPDMTQSDLAEWAHQQYHSEKKPSQTTISRILSSKNDLVASKESEFQLIRRRKQTNPLLRQILTEWVTQAVWENIPITMPIIQSTANSIWTRLPIEFKDGNGVFNQKWCNHFLKKLNINLKDDPSDSGPYDLNKIWLLDEKVELKSYLHDLVIEKNYKPQDIFTIDEFQLFYSLPLDQIFDMNSIDKGLKQSSSSTENSLTVMLGTNIDGSEKLTPLIVGKYDNFDVSNSSFDSLKNSSHHSNSNFMNKLTEIYQIYYKNNVNKWITSTMFQNYLLTLDHKLSNSSPGRNILIILDDSSSHRILNLKFNHIKLIYLKNNTNHKSPFNSLYNGVNFDYLPMNFGIVHEFKVLYRLQQYTEMISLQKKFNRQSSGDIASDVLSENDYAIPQVKAIEWIKRAWDSVSQEKILKSWIKTHSFNLKKVWPNDDHINIMVENLNNFDFDKSYDKLSQVMKSLNVVIPWNIDELLGLVNERVKATLMYVSIEEIVSSCVLESKHQEVDDKFTTPNTLVEFNDNWVINQMMDQSPLNDSMLQPMLQPLPAIDLDLLNSNEDDQSYDKNIKSNSPGTMTMDTLLAAVDHQINKERPDSKPNTSSNQNSTQTQILKHKLSGEEEDNTNDNKRRSMVYPISHLPRIPSPSCQLNDSLPSSTASSPHNNNNTQLFSKKIYSGVTYKSPSQDNLPGGSNFSSDLSIIKLLTKIIETAEGVSLSSFYSSSSSSSSLSSSPSSASSSVFIPLKLSRSTINELKQNLKEAQRRYEQNKHKRN